MTTLVQVQDIDKSFPLDGGNTYLALKGIDLQIRKGEFISLIGHSGCGKSTLLNMIAGLDLPTAGTVLVDGETVRRPGPDKMVVFQNYSLLPWLTVRENIALAVDEVMPALSRAERDAMVDEHIAMVGLGPATDKRPGELSGGMRQRVAIARTLILRPRVILMDEPFGALDPATRLDMQDLLVKLWREVQATVLFVTHSVEEAVYLGARGFVMATTPGRIAEEIRMPAAAGPARGVQSEPWFHEQVNAIHARIEQVEAAAKHKNGVSHQI